MVTALTLVFVALYCPIYTPSIHVGISGCMWGGVGYVLVKILIFLPPIVVGGFIQYLPFNGSNMKEA